MTRAEAMGFAEAWAETWNARNLAQILDLYAENVVFSSPKAAALTGHGTLEGKADLRRYWEAALQRIDSLHFELLEAHWDPEATTLWVTYRGELNGTRHRSSEVFKFGPDGKVREGAAFYGAPA